MDKECWDQGDPANSNKVKKPNMLHEQRPKGEKASYKQQDPLNSRNGKKKGQGQNAWGGE